MTLASDLDLIHLFIGTCQTLKELLFQPLTWLRSLQGALVLNDPAPGLLSFPLLNLPHSPHQFQLNLLTIALDVKTLTFICFLISLKLRMQMYFFFSPCYIVKVP